MLALSTLKDHRRLQQLLHKLLDFCQVLAVRLPQDAMMEAQMCSKSFALWVVP
jgi:hypothetical protein